MSAATTTTARRAEHRVPAVVPQISATVASLVAQVQAEAEASTLAALSAKDGIVTLHDCDRATASLQILLGGDDIQLTGADGYNLQLHRRRFEPESWRGCAWMKGRWRPGQWDVIETRIDGAGRAWICNLGAHITDDFGALVCVEKGGAA
jgi:hypothetical protein